MQMLTFISQVEIKFSKDGTGTLNLLDYYQQDITKVLLL